MNGPKWTSEEDRQLETMLLAGFSYAQIAKAIGRSRNAIKGRRDRQFSHINNQGGAITWTRGNDAVLQLLYPLTTAANIANILGCTKSAIRNRAFYLGIKSTGRPQWNAFEIGARRIYNGYETIKVKDHGESRERWKFTHRQLWEDHHGPIPPDHFVTFKDGNRDNITLDNLQLVAKRDHLLQNHINRMPNELRPIFYLRKKVIRELRKHDNKEKHK